MPRALDEEGRRRRDLFAFELASADNLPRFVPGVVVLQGPDRSRAKHQSNKRRSIENARFASILICRYAVSLRRKTAPVLLGP